MRELDREREASEGPSRAARLVVFSTDAFAAEAASWFARRLPNTGRVMITGGAAAGLVYPRLAQLDASWAGLEVFFSDERCVPPDDEASNFGMADRLLLEAVHPRAVHRVRGELPPQEAAAAYERDLAGARNEIGLALLGLGENGHICALFPGATALAETRRSCVAVHRPDGMDGVTVTPPVLDAIPRIGVLAVGAGCAEAVRRTLRGTEDVAACPSKLLVARPGVTFLMDEPAAAFL